MQTITLNGKTDSDLCWEEEIAQTSTLQTSTLWHLDLGLFSGLKAPLEDQAQYQSIALSLDHFYDKVWKEHASTSEGVVIYSGPASFSWDPSLELVYQAWKGEFTKYPFSEEEGKQIFCAQRAFDYFELLTNRVPDDLPVFVEIDDSSLLPLHTLGQSLFSERSQHVNVKLSSGTSVIDKASPIGLLLPLMECVSCDGIQRWESAAQRLRSNNQSFRIVSEDFIINQWDGLDQLIVDPEMLSPSGVRKLQGFCAAGGEVINLGSSLQLPYERDYHEWIDKNGS